MKYLFAFLVMIAPTSVWAYSSSPEETYLEQFNQQLERFASESNYKIAYENAVFVSPPTTAAYISLEAPSLSLVYEGFRYELTTRKIALIDNDDGTKRVSVPSTIRLNVSPADSSDAPAMFRLDMRGLPALDLRSTAQSTDYRLTNKKTLYSEAGKIEFKIKRLNINEKPAQAGILSFQHNIKGTSSFQPVSAVPSHLLGAILKAIVTEPLTALKNIR